MPVNNLRKCPTCGSDVSVRAPSCPKCGEPFALGAAKVGGVNMRDPVHLIGVVLAVVIALGSILAIILTFARR